MCQMAEKIIEGSELELLISIGSCCGNGRIFDKGNESHLLPRLESLEMKGLIRCQNDGFVHQTYSLSHAGRELYGKILAVYKSYSKDS